MSKKRIVSQKVQEAQAEESTTSNRSIAQDVNPRQPRLNSEVIINVSYVNKDKFHKWTIGTLNIRSGKEKEGGAKMYSIANEVDMAGVTVCCIQEVRHLNTDRKTIRLANGNEYVFIWSGLKRRRDAGVGFLIRVDKSVVISEAEVCTHRIIAINIDIYGFKVRVVNAYSPTNVDGSINQKEEFYRTLRKACSTKGKHQKLIVTGDFNAETSVVLRKCNFNYESVIEDVNCNDNGDRLKTFVRSHRLAMVQSFFEHELDARYTWFSNDHTTKKVLDYVLVERYLEQYVESCYVANEFNFETDHRLLITAFDTPSTKRARWRKRNKIVRSVNAKALKKPEIKEAYIEAVKKEFRTCEKEDSEIIAENIKISLKNYAEKAIPDTAYPRYGGVRSR